MDILTHTFSGTAIGIVGASFLGRNYKHTKQQGYALVAASTIAGAFPDIDAITLWSKFDATLGKIFSFKHTGAEIYFGKFWYSHHAFFHSLSASLLFSLFLALLFTFFVGFFFGRTQNRYYKKLSSNKSENYSRCQDCLIFFLTVFFAYNAHLLEDMPTPASVWGGVNYFYPFSSYVGGSGQIWWWNNYDIFLIVVATIFINLLVLFFAKILNFKAAWFTLAVLLLGVSLMLFQIRHRPMDFSYEGFSKNYSVFEKQSKEIQKNILGKNLYRFMENLDKKIPWYF